MVDALVLGTSIRKDVGVQVLSPAQNLHLLSLSLFLPTFSPVLVSVLYYIDSQE